jgi:hypothetical protein
LPTNNTNGSDVPRSDPLDSGPPRLELRGMIEEWREEHWERMDCWIDCGGLPPPPPPPASPRLSFSPLGLLSVEGEGGDAGCSFLDQFHVDEHLTSDRTPRSLPTQPPWRGPRRPPPPPPPPDEGWEENDGAFDEGRCGHGCGGGGDDAKDDRTQTLLDEA